MTTELVLTNSEVSTFEDCKRKWWLAHYRKLGRIDEKQFNTPGAIGTVYHAALAAYYGEQKDPVGFANDYYKRRLQELADLPSLYQEVVLADLSKEADLVVTMLEGYVQYLEEDAPDENLRVLGAEEHVTVDLVKGVTLQGKIDAPAEYRSDGDPMFVQLEHKTVGNLTDLPRTAKVNKQFLTYDLLAFLRERIGEGRRTDGVLLNMARKVKRTSRAKPPFYGRHPVRHNDEELRNHWLHLVSVAREIQETQARLDAGESHHKVVPPRPTRDCTWKCPFAGPCLAGMFDDGSDVEGYLAVNFVEVDPLSRYAEDTEKEEA